MNAKAFLIPLAAFALSATAVSAFNTDILIKAGLNETQIEALQNARELHKDGDKEKAREVLVEAGIDLETMESMRKAMHEQKDAMRTAIDAAIEANDFEAFKLAIADSPLADIVITEDDFSSFSEAHKLHEEGEHQKAKEIMEELGFEPHHKGHILGGFMSHKFGERHNKNHE